MKAPKAIVLMTLSLCLTLCAASCSRHRFGTEELYFCSLNNPDNRKAEFQVDFSDSAAVYSLELVARFPMNYEAAGTTLLVEVRSPSGAVAYERVYLPAGYHTVRDYLRKNGKDAGIKISGTHAYYDVAWKYRDNVLPKEKGLWQLSLKPLADAQNVLGLGISVKHVPLVTPDNE